MNPTALPFPEFDQLHSILGQAASHGSGLIRTQTLAQVSTRDQRHRFPIWGFSLGNPEPSAPTLGIVGGVHGLERIGSLLALSLLDHLVQRLDWDEGTQELLQKIRVCFVPLLNPVGTFLGTRSNENGVDLMRNAPLDAEVPWWFLPGGHRISPRLPWFRGLENHPPETGTLALTEFVRRETFQSRFSIWLDCHSGFGVRDQLWFPYASHRRPFEQLSTVMSLKELFDESHRNHVYKIEPQSLNYTNHGDVWDWLSLEHQKTGSPAPFLPLTLEMGSWSWVKKNPSQIFSFLGPFNPIQPHRKRRTLRRHMPLFDFLLRAVRSHERWRKEDQEARDALTSRAHQLWYRSS